MQSTITAWMRALESKDDATAGHARRTAEYATKIARELPWIDETLLERVRLAALLHDMGKLAIEDAILTKPAALGDEELREMRRHPELGYELVSRVAGLEDAALGVLFHHERWDGQGYPYRLSGQTIPWIARLIAVADAFDAMVGERPYRESLTARQACDEIRRLSGTQFDPEMAGAFLRAFAREAAVQTSFEPDVSAGAASRQSATLAPL
jgi:HD-GYP domain-containing protein (c-di-GMP phosphodiesterase class II)